MAAAATAARPGMESEKEKDELLENCGVCKKKLRLGIEPQLMPCLHSVCRGCLGSEPDPNCKEGLVNCPVCKQQCFQKDIMENYFMTVSVSGGASGANSESDASRAAPVQAQSCTSCEDNATATSYCVECLEWLCDACVEAHQRVKFTKDHTVRKETPRPGGVNTGENVLYCSVHKQEPLKLFCETCETVTCRDCQLHSHKDHQYQFLDDAIRNQRKVLGALTTRLGDKNTNLQKSAKEVRNTIRDVTDIQKRIHVEIKMAILQIMKELNRRGKMLLSSVQKLAEEQQEKLERQYWAMTKLQRQHEHILRFASWALGSDNNMALLLCRKLIYFQLHRNLKALVDPVDPLGEVKFQWDPEFWAKQAESFGKIISEKSGNTTSNAQATGNLMAPPVTNQTGSAGQQANAWSKQTTPTTPLATGAATGKHRVTGSAAANQQAGQSPTVGPNLSGNFLQKMQVQLVQQGGVLQINQQQQQQVMGQLVIMPQVNGIQMAEGSGAALGSGEADNDDGNPSTSGKSSPAGKSSLLGKVPRVSLERLEVDLSPDCQLPVFKVMPGNTTEEYNLIVIEGNNATPGAAGPGEPPLGNVQTPGAVPDVAAIKTEDSSQPIVIKTEDSPPLAAVIKTENTGPWPIEIPTDSSIPSNLPGVGGDGIQDVERSSRCEVCLKAGELLTCSQCERKFHTHCHIPELHEFPSGVWKCLLCRDPAEQVEQYSCEILVEGDAVGLPPASLKKCERLLLQLLCHESSKPFHKMAANATQGDPIDLTIIKGKLLKKLLPHYSTPDDFAADVWLMFKVFSASTEDKDLTQSIIELQTFFEEKLKDLPVENARKPDGEAAGGFDGLGDSRASSVKRSSSATPEVEMEAKRPRTDE
ncbi:transcription intermediary factor 1-beta isoform X1 [Protopterus annectens]|uniref:transcription intermediary factor 1-beta isoform X1 n=1 Tax=Protopterus annectens TaxID=7888 RepID=UPI001CFA1D25|nr:transcription intermediary factor 1-beta isoform X1 [Protopterus annectens]UAT11616.1 tripartite motif containing 28 [Protopterus annectens]